MTRYVEPRLEKIIRDELALANEWHFVHGSKHWKLFVNGRMAAILPKGPIGSGAQKANIGVRAHIRRVLRETQP